ncbi:MAG TPA: TonB-dependent receptor, partial [Flavobacteriales bacterium]|nr:TonB-dependent receptor [Flavobacteriales bacterium]
AGNALRNGDQPQSVYSVWTNIGTTYNSNGKTDISQFRVTANGSADLGKHSFTLGFEYEQRDDRFFNVSPVGLWFQGRLLQNKHINEIPEDALKDSYRTIYSFGDNLIYEYAPQNTSPGEYNAANTSETQSFFDYNVRLAMGLDPDGTDFLDIDSYDPAMFKLNFFSADELLNSGNSYVTYSGYDHTGERVKGNTTLDDFFNARDSYGNKLRSIGAFQPIYNSVYLMDKFAFDDLIFNIGLRVDRYDANQSVLKDKFLLYPAKTVGEITSADNLTGSDNIPSNIGTDYIVYIDDEQSRTITGYRNGSQWYNAQGVEVTDDPSVIFGSSNQAVPVLAVEKNGTDGTHIDAFEDYKPQINVMPRIAFSFPINDEALFFAHYDVLTKRPTTGSRLDITDYYYIFQNGGIVFNNPNLKPEKTIDYELGFQQVLTKSSSLKISAFYKELRNMVTVVQVYGAYPLSYKSFDNIDFGTVKGMTLTYDLRRTKNLWMKASYTLQFAEGTGSNAGSQQGLINAGLPNLRTVLPFDYDQRHAFQFTVDYHYGEGKDYNGPRIGKTDLLANTGINFITIFGSGTPYTQWDFPAPQAFLAGNFNGSVFGNINGARTPGQFRMDVNIDKNLTLKFGKKGKETEGEGEAAATAKERKTANLNIYFWITNLLNRKNINSVYSGTGNPQDDGYLTDARYTNAIIGKNDPDAFRYYYGLKANNPFNYGLPRQIRLGI